MSVLAIDQGTTSTRALRLDAHGSAKIVKSLEHRQIYPQPGWVEHDPEELIANVLACAEAAGDAEAVGIDNQGESCLAWDAQSKRAISPVLVWQDSRTQDVVDGLKRSGAEAETLERAGLPLDSYFSASKLAWIFDTLPEAKDLHAKGRLRLGTTDAFFLDRLTGRFVTDVTTASRTSLMNLQSLRWDEDLCALFGVPPDALPQIVPTTGDFGAMESGGKRLPVLASIVDQQAALYGHGCRAAGDVKVTFGTGAFVLMVTGPQIIRAPDQGLLPTVAWQRAGEAPVYALDGGVYSASAAVNWARSLGLFDTLDELNRLAGEPAIAKGLVFVPALSGLACPHWDRTVRGAWLGLSIDHGADDMMKAVLEGVALRAAEVVNAMDERLAIEGPLSIDGGLSNNPYFNQFLADILQRDIQVSQVGELTALGTANLVAETLGQPAASAGGGQIFLPKSDRREWMARFSKAVTLARSWP